MLNTQAYIESDNFTKIFTKKTFKQNIIIII